jgi:hypothetical protein
MKPDPFVKIVLSLIALFLGVMAFRPYLAPRPAQAQSPEAYQVYIEPGTTILTSPDGRSQQIGKVVVDLRNGNIWGFPTLTSQPYPVDRTTPEPPVSRPMYLGRYDFSAMNRPPAGK